MSIVEEIKSLPSSVKAVVVCDTDGHGVSLGAAYFRALTEGTGVPEERVAIVSHFDPRGPATAGRGDVVTVIKVLSEWAERVVKETGEKPVVYFLDVPLVQGKEVEQLKALQELSRHAKVVWVDHIGHSNQYAGAPLPGLTDVDFRLVNSTLETFGPAVVALPDQLQLQLALFGTASDMQLNELPPNSALVNRYARLVEAVQEVDKEKVDRIVRDFEVESLRSHYDLFVAMDQALKFGKFPEPTTKAALVGNSAPKVAFLAKEGLVGLARLAKEQFMSDTAKAKIPTMEEVAKNITVNGVVAVCGVEAPRGLGFKLAALTSAATKAPVSLVVAEGFTPDKKILILAPNTFEDPEGKIADVTTALKNKVFSALVEKGISDPQTDFPRGEAAYSIGVKADAVDEAVKTVAQVVNSEFAKLSVQVTASKIADEALAVLVPDRTARAAMLTALNELLKQHLGPVVESVKRLEAQVSELSLKVSSLHTDEPLQEKSKVRA